MILDNWNVRCKKTRKVEKCESFWLNWNKFEVVSLFQMIDDEKKGFVTISDLKDMIHKIMPHVSPTEINSFFSDPEMNKFDRLDLEAFTELINKL